MTSKSPKISGSQVAPRQKIKLLPDSPLIGILKPEHYEIVDPGSLESLDVAYQGLPNPGGSVDLEAELGIVEEDQEELDEFMLSLVAPNLDDIQLVKSETYFDVNGNEVARFSFKIRNHVGDLVVGVNGYGA